MRRYRIKFARRAWRQIDRASSWWRRHRDKAPHAFDEDLDAALRLLRTNPGVGEPIRDRLGTRRYWMERIRYFLYYRVTRDGVVEISALWHASRRTRPRL